MGLCEGQQQETLLAVFMVRSIHLELGMTSHSSWQHSQREMDAFVVVQIVRLYQLITTRHVTVGV